MLTDKEKKDIANELARYQSGRAACIEALKAVQKHRGWISDEALRDVADFLKMTPDELDSVATFYSLLFRKPTGRHVILVCDSISCWISGYEPVRDHLQARLRIRLGGTTEDHRFTLLPVVCLGACGGAPAMMIDGDLHENLNGDKIDRILQGYK